MPRKLLPKLNGARSRSDYEIEMLITSANVSEANVEEAEGEGIEGIMTSIDVLPLETLDLHHPDVGARRTEEIIVMLR